jgi:hypothetical protein
MQKKRRNQEKDMTDDKADLALIQAPGNVMIQKRASLIFQGMPFLIQLLRNNLNYGYVYCGRTFGALLNVKRNPVALIKRFKPGRIDSRMMDKNIRTVFLLDKTIPLAAVKPFYYAISHCNNLL